MSSPPDSAIFCWTCVVVCRDRDSKKRRKQEQKQEGLELQLELQEARKQLEAQRKRQVSPVEELDPQVEVELPEAQKQWASSNYPRFTAHCTICELGSIKY